MLALVSRGGHQGVNYTTKRNKVYELLGLTVIDGNGTLVYLHCYPLDDGYRSWKINP
ncbi:MAG: hypothetical protein ACXAEU_10335 [Candidatus Hodarchaeales archaeon]